MRPLFSPSDTVAPALNAVVRSFRPHAVVVPLGQGTDVRELAVDGVALIASVAADPTNLALKEYDAKDLRTDIAWSALPSGWLFQASSKHDTPLNSAQ